MSWADQSSQAETPEGRALVEQVGMDTYTKEMAQTAPTEDGRRAYLTAVHNKEIGGRAVDALFHRQEGSA
ncbi:hypothetical protein ACFFR3_45635 [Nonomuraea salmonea]|uniref:Uncharacterized protein n=1 Tax=Nonomuraea salmonea TaxID=46181 RepID=A0ABV5P2X0_9ACTN